MNLAELEIRVESLEAKQAEDVNAFVMCRALSCGVLYFADQFQSTHCSHQSGNGIPLVFTLSR